MGGKKKGKKKAKKTKEKKDDDDENKDEVNEDYIVNLPSYGWIRLWLKLCDPPTPLYNNFRTIMRSNQSLLDVKSRIIDFHGRIENINLYNTDPYPARNKANDFKKEKKPRVPPYNQLSTLLKLKKEKEDLMEEEAKRAKKDAEANPNPTGLILDDKNAVQDSPLNDKRFEILQYFDFPEDLKGDSIVQYNSDKLTLYDIFQDYGTEAKPAVDPKNDPEPPKPKEKPELKSPSKKVEPKEEKEEEEKKEEGAGDEDGQSPAKVEVEEEPEEVYIPPVEKVLWYDFDAFDGKDPVLLALMQIDLEEKGDGK